MTRVALVTSEAIRPRMAGIGIRYYEMARRLPQYGLETVVVSESSGEAEAELGLRHRPFRRGALRDITRDVDVVVTQGQLANDVTLEIGDLPVVVDLYDPWLVENLHYRESLGLDPYRNDHASWNLQMSRGDFFLCSSEEQRLYYLGFLTAIGRVNPDRVETDPDLRRLIDVVPFGVPEELPPHRPVLAPREGDELRLFFGGLYEWYDPWPLLRALEELRERDWRLYFVALPNEGTPQALLRQVERHCRRAGTWERQVFVLGWQPFERRYDLLRDCDAMIVTQQTGLETELSWRTRFLDALAVGCPIITQDGGAFARLIKRERAGWVIGSEAELTNALEAVRGEQERQERSRAGLELARRHQWDRVLEPLVAFCREPKRDPTKEDFASPSATHSRSDSFGFRLRRFLRVRFGRSI